MAALHERMPGDPDVAAFYALALLGTMARGLAGAAEAHEGHSAALAGSATQTRVTAILEQVLRAHPNHPGALHYLLHNNDDPAHARAGAAGGACLRQGGAGVEPRAPYAGAYLRAARDVARCRAVGSRRVWCVRCVGESEAASSGDAQLSRARRGCSTSCSNWDATPRRGKPWRRSNQW